MTINIRVSVEDVLTDKVAAVFKQEHKGKRVLVTRLLEKGDAVVLCVHNTQDIIVQEENKPK